MRKGKAYAEAAHFKRQLYRRYRVRLNRHEYRALCDVVRSGRATFLRRQSQRVSIYALEINGTTVPVVYDAMRHRLVTALPQEALHAGA